MQDVLYKSFVARPSGKQKVLYQQFLPLLLVFNLVQCGSCTNNAGVRKTYAVGEQALN